MGLLKENVQLENGLVAPQVYYKITNFNGDKNSVYFTVSAFASREAFISGYPELFKHGYYLPYEEGDILALGYTGLKMKPEFLDAIDVLEENQLA